LNSRQVVLITGSSTGFGRLFTKTLARKGHAVFATMRDPAGRNAQNASEIRTVAEKDSLPIHVLEGCQGGMTGKISFTGSGSSG
jgi:NAD(P)-dependent dehydrogenase (short-subunit alcohol dehydrogenase family)